MEAAPTGEGEHRLEDLPTRRLDRILRGVEVGAVQHDQRAAAVAGEIQLRAEEAAIDTGADEAAVVRAVVDEAPAEYPGEEGLARLGLAAGDFQIVDAVVLVHGLFLAGLQLGYAYLLDRIQVGEIGHLHGAGIDLVLGD